MSKLYLSNSQINTYRDCPRKWYLDKVKRLRPNWTSSALIFGSAIDAAVEHYLLTKKTDYLDVFENSMRKFQINGVDKTLPENLLDVRFTNGDVDIDVLKVYFETTYPGVWEMFCDELGVEAPDIGEFFEYAKQQKRNKNKLSDTEQKLINFISWNSLEAKGIMILDKLREWIDENVEEVHEVQKKIEIENANGDKFIGFLDFIVTLKDGRKVLIDLKTSSSPNTYYPPQSASESVQLGIYSQEEQVPDVAYLVADKSIRKRHPKVRLKYVEGVITEEHLDEVFDDIEEVTTEIKANLDKGKKGFPKNKDSCVKFGGCQYFSYCNKNKDMTGLCYVKKNTTKS